jgi:hypothetical protein
MHEVSYQALVIPTEVGIQSIFFIFISYAGFPLSRERRLDSRFHGNDETNESNEANRDPLHQLLDYI